MSTHWISYPLGPFVSAIETLVGWLLAVIVTSWLGAAIGLLIGNGFQSTTLELSLWLLLLSPVVWLLIPKLLIAYVSALIAWYLPIHYESQRLRLACLGMNMTIWVIVYSQISPP